jgi:acyl-CoA reductase-like NAD-dependent aldehyde dehydrogenase
MARPVEVRNPRTGQNDYRIDAADPSALAAEAARLRRAQPAWEAAGVRARIAALQDFAAAVEAEEPAILAALVADTGRYGTSFGEVKGLVALIRGWASRAAPLLADSERESSTLPGVRLTGAARPYPLAGFITPWNLPLMLSLIDALPALLAGCAALIKPSEVTPRFIAPLKRAIEKVPALAAVLAYVEGDGATGAALVDLVDIVVFTGSVPTGRKVAAQAAARFIPAILEMGGKDPAIVLPSADMERAVTACLRGATYDTGQHCLSIERIYVPRPMFDEFVSRLVEKASQVELTYPDLRKGHIGPFIFARQAEIVQAQIDAAVRDGAKVRCGGRVEHLGGGVYLRPTVVTDVTHRMAIMREETFGPVLPVMAYDTVEEAVSLANDTDFGLSAAVIGEEGEAQAVARRLNCGAVTINDSCLTGATFQDLAKNSHGLSGMGGSRMGESALTRFLRRQVLIRQTGPARDLLAANTG